MVAWRGILAMAPKCRAVETCIYLSLVGPIRGSLGAHMAKPNYQFEKRRREMDKKAKKAEKLKRKDAPASADSSDSSDATPATDATTEAV